MESIAWTSRSGANETAVLVTYFVFFLQISILFLSNFNFGGFLKLLFVGVEIIEK